MKITFKLFLWYSKLLGYDVSISREKGNSYELYSNTKIIKFEDPISSLDISSEKPIPPPTQIIKEGEDPNGSTNRFYKFKNARISYLDLKQMEKAGGIAVLISKKVNEIINIININRLPE
jgi:hypothetical protein